MEAIAEEARWRLHQRRHAEAAKIGIGAEAAEAADIEIAPRQQKLQHN